MYATTDTTHNTCNNLILQSRSIKTAKAEIALLLLGGLAIVQKEEISHQVVKYTGFSYGGYCFSTHMYPDMIR
jgi:hypothetical protein